MSLPPFVYQHGIQTIKYLYDLYGYEQLIKEIKIIHHIHGSSNEDVHEIPIPQEPIEVKNVIIECNPDPKEKYERIPLTPEIQCTSLLKNGKQCSSHRKKSSLFCIRHDPQK
jgi:hypothetical protein